MRDKASFNVRSGEVVTSVDIAHEMRGIALRAAEPVSAGETVKAQQRRAWEALRRLPFWRVRAAWYGEAGCWSAVAVDEMRRLDAERRKKEAKGREAANELAAILATAAERLRVVDPDFYREQIAQHERAARALGAPDRAVAETGEAE